MISYRIPAVRYHGLLVFYAAFKDHLSFFPGSSTTRRRLARYIRPFDAGKGTLHFPLDRPLPIGLVRRIVRMRIAENRARARARPARSRK